MGLLVNGVWQEHEPEATKDGHFERRDTSFRNWVTPDARPGPTGQDGFERWRGAIICMSRSPAPGRTGH